MSGGGVAGPGSLTAGAGCHLKGVARQENLAMMQFKELTDEVVRPVTLYEDESYGPAVHIQIHLCHDVLRLSEK